MTLLIKLLVILISLYAAARLFHLTWREGRAHNILTSLEKIKFTITGFVANVFDTLGIGSFAVIIAFDKHWNLMDDQKLPGTLNAQSILPTLCQALFFLQVVQVDTTTLGALVVAASIGGFFGGFLVSRLDKQRIRMLMFFGYLGIAALIILNKLGYLPVGGDKMGLEGIWLLAGFLGMILAGALPAIGVGAYAPTQVILFLLGMSPLAAFPIMTASGAFQQSVAAMAFIQREQVALKPSMMMAFAGVAGVLVAAPVITYIRPESLRSLLLMVVLYNVFMLWKSSRQRDSIGKPISMSQ